MCVEALDDLLLPVSLNDLEQSIPERFEFCARARPKSTAISFNGAQISYGALNERANRIAHALIQSMPDNTEPVAVFCRQGIDQIAAIFAVLKCGRAYVPLDNYWERATLETALSDSEATLIVTDNANESLGVTLSAGRVPILNCQSVELDMPCVDFEYKPPPNTTAYIYYTSGTTGRAKGVMDSHRNVLHNILRYTESLGFSPEDRMTLIQSCGFSGAVSNVFGALLNGACLLPFDLPQTGIANLAKWVRAEQATIFHSVPALFEQLCSSAKGFPSVRIVRLEGDQALPRHAVLFDRTFERRSKLVNGLGITETGLILQNFVERGIGGNYATLPVGVPTRDTVVLILNDDGQEVAEGDIGEIVVESRYLAIGYHNAPDLTASVFRTNHDAPHRRRYHTRDLGCRRRDGKIELVGRRDNQIKIHGRWVDSVCVEAALRALPDIEDAVVIGWERLDRHPQLVAYFVPCEASEIDVPTLRRQLTEQSSGIPIPTRFLEIDSVPLTANGKVDRSALPDPRYYQPPMDRGIVQPRDGIEVHLKKIWQDLLMIESIGVNEDFFDLGGDSVLAMNLVLEVERIFGVTFPFDTLWAGRATIAKIAEVLKADESPRIWHTAVPIKPVNTGQVLFVVHTSSGHLSDYLALARLLREDQSVYGLQALGIDGRDPPHQTVRDLAAHCISLMREQQPAGPYAIAGYSSGGLIAYEMARQLADRDLQVAPLVLIDVVPPSGFLSGLVEIATSLRRGEWRAAQERGYQVALKALGLGKLRSLRNVGESHRWALWSYRLKSYRNRIHIITSAETRRYTDIEAVWRRYATEVEARALGGDHRSLIREPEVQRLASHVQAILDEKI